MPYAYVQHDVWIRNDNDEIVIGCRGDIIAHHPPCREREDVVFDPAHYLPLIEHKINSLDQAAPFQRWDVADGFATLPGLWKALWSGMGGGNTHAGSETAGELLACRSAYGDPASTRSNI